MSTMSFMQELELDYNIWFKFCFSFFHNLTITFPYPKMPSLPLLLPLLQCSNSGRGEDILGSISFGQPVVSTQFCKIVDCENLEVMEI